LKKVNAVCAVDTTGVFDVFEKDLFNNSKVKDGVHSVSEGKIF
jgi:hypothetical protein